MQFVLLPGIERKVREQTWTDRGELSRHLQRRQERGIGAGQVLKSHGCVDGNGGEVGRTGRGRVPSAPVRLLARDHL